MSFVRDFLTAFGFLTILPIPAPEEPEDAKALPRSMFFFPLVGTILAMFAFMIYLFLNQWIAFQVADVFLLLIPIILTGGLHLDGLADFSDGFFGGRNRERILEIMRDSRIGTFGASAIVISLMLKLELLHVIPAKLQGFIFALTAARWAQVALSFFNMPARDSGLGHLAAQVGLRELIGATAFLFAVVIWAGWSAMISFLMLCFFLFFYGWYVRHKVGGVTGDVLGAASELSELIVLFGMTLIPYQGF